MSFARLHSTVHPIVPFLPQPTPAVRVAPRPAVLVLAAQGADSVPAEYQQQLDALGQISYLSNLEPLSPAAFVALAQPYEYLAITRRAVVRLDRSMLEALPRLKGLSVYSTGVEWLDTDYLRQRGIRLAALPDYCTNAVAETALGMMFMVAHKLHLRYLKSLKTVPDTVSLRGFELQNCRIGIIGCGRIGRSLAQKLRSLCREVLVNDPDEQALQAAAALGARCATQGEILTTCRMVVCCASQQFFENQLFASGDYELLSPQSVVLNVGRTSLLDHDRLVGMVKRRELLSYVFDDLLRPQDDPDEVEYGKIIPTGHTAWYTDEALRNGTQTWIENLINLCNTR